MATELLAIGNTAAASSDVTVEAGTPVTVCLKGAESENVLVHVQLKDDGGAYHTIGHLGTSHPVVVIAGPGAYRVQRVRGKCGVFSG